MMKGSQHQYIFSTAACAIAITIVLWRQGILLTRSASAQVVQSPGEPQCQHPKYNQKMMDFLEMQLAKGRRLRPPPDLARDLKLAFERGERLLDKHRGPFDLKTYYRSADVKEIVEEVCDTLQVIADPGKNEEMVEIAREVPGECFKADKDYLANMLAYILDVNKNGLETDVSEEWKKVKHEHLDRMKDLEVIDDEELSGGKEIGRGSGCIVYESRWRKVPVAVKRCLYRQWDEQDVEQLAEFFKDVLRHVSLRSLHVAKLYAITKSSYWLVLELADMDLKAFCDAGKVRDWPMKRSLIQQAAERLRYMHSQDPPLVHSDVKTANFLVFGAQPTVKIADFGLTHEVTRSMAKSVRRGGGTWEYMPPESFHGEALSLASDVYSFGIVMYEIVTGRVLYQCRHRSEVYILAQKVREKEPCTVRLTDCPTEMSGLMQECCRADPKKRPVMDEVCYRLEGMPDIPSKKSVEDLHPIIDSASEQWPHVRYNGRILHFLLSQMERVKALRLPLDMSTGAWNTLKGELESGKHLIHRHACTFDLQRFYTVDEVTNVVERICMNLQDSVCSLDTGNSLGIAYGIPDDDVCEDRSFLEARLRFVLSGEQISETARHRDEWDGVRKRHEERMANVKIISDDEIDWESAQEIGSGGAGAVYKVHWGGQEVAAKQLIPKGRALKVERLAHVFTEAAISASFGHGHITRVLALTKSGCTLVMELATGNLRTWYRGHRGASGPLRVNLMYQAASGLAQVHSQADNFVHCDIKSTNFLVFDLDDCPIVKLCDFGTATTQLTETKTTLRQQPRTALYCAPEIYARKPHSQKSDVFSFGVVMCELAGQRTPYADAEGLNPAVMKMKEMGDLPCRIPSDLPKGLKPLIVQCLEHDPGRRPTMQEVQETLRDIVHAYSPAS